MDNFNFPVTDILLLDQNDSPIQIFSSTVKEKDVAIDFSRKETKITRSYTLKEKKLLTKQIITGTFETYMNLNTLSDLGYYENVESKILENYSVVFSNSKTKVSLTLKNCNVSMKGKINFKINKPSNISFKAEAQGDNNEFYEIKQGDDVVIIDFNYFLKEIAGIKNDINALSKGDLIDPPILSAATTTFKKDEVYKDKNNLYWRVKEDFTKSGGYPGGLPDSNFIGHSVKENGKSDYKEAVFQYKDNFEIRCQKIGKIIVYNLYGSTEDDGGTLSDVIITNTHFRPDKTTYVSLVHGKQNLAGEVHIRSDGKLYVETRQGTANASGNAVAVKI